MFDPAAGRQRISRAHALAELDEPPPHGLGPDELARLASYFQGGLEEGGAGGAGGAAQVAGAGQEQDESREFQKGSVDRRSLQVRL